MRFEKLTKRKGDIASVWNRDKRYVICCNFALRQNLGDVYARAYMKIKEVDRRLSLESVSSPHGCVRCWWWIGVR